jgi:hypothetical protein
MIDMDRVNPDSKFFSEPAEDMKKAHRIGASGEADNDVLTFFDQVIINNCIFYSFRNHASSIA